MADDYVRETLRTLRERTGDAYVPLSQAVRALRRIDGVAEGCWESVPAHKGFAAVDAIQKVVREELAKLERRWGPGPRCARCGDTGMVVAYTDSAGAPIGECCDCEAALCERCDDTGHMGDEWCSCAAADARAKLVEERLPLTPEAIRERMEAARGPTPELDSPNFAPQELREFEARGYDRQNRRG